MTGILQLKCRALLLKTVLSPQDFYKFVNINSVPDKAKNGKDLECYYIFDGRGHPNGYANFVLYSTDKKGDDIHYFFNTLVKFCPFLDRPSASRYVTTELYDFLERVVPDKYRSGSRVAEKGRILVNDEYLIPQKCKLLMVLF